jgi:coenzyme F420-reducing hydrogenase delta subunit
MWASAAEGERFAVLIRKATEIVKKLGPNKKFEKKW